MMKIAVAASAVLLSVAPSMASASNFFFFPAKPHQESRLCETVGTLEHCTTQPQVEAGWLSIYNQEQHRSKNLGRMIVNGQCEEARRYALEKGDFRLFHNAVAMCMPAEAAKVAAATRALAPQSADLSPYEQGVAQARADRARMEGQGGE